MPQQIIKFQTDGMFPALYIDLDEVAGIGSVDVPNFSGPTGRISVLFKSNQAPMYLNKSFAADLEKYMDAWMAYKNSLIV